MSEPVALTIQGVAPNGHMLVVCDWPNLCAVPVPEAKVIEQPYPVYREIPKEVKLEDVPMRPLYESWILWGLVLLATIWTMREVRLWYRGRRRR